ncbi:glycoside hydrolase family 15 protein [Leifsonia sp. NPDC058292]|uniref:glycoside hydrolase family 15 protein n=1 Tax=Leifsonia sp. NPDC058292 TaxID=3346428 RepID=UPI0036DF7200
MTAARTRDGSPPLRDYAAIGDGRTVALIGRDGSVDWLPVPDLDAVPVFAHLIDAEAGGRIELAPRDPFETKRRYVRGTNVLETTFTTASGSVKVTDALVTGIAGRLPWAELARRIEGVDGAVRMRWAVRPGTALGTASPWIQHVGGDAVIRDGSVTIGVTGLDHHPSRTRSRQADDDTLRGGFSTGPGSRHTLVVVATEGEPLHLPRAEKVEQGIDRTIANWRSWSREFSYDGPWAPAVQRSALALKLLTYAPSGAIAAAATTSLPEAEGGGKNWDYRFAWVRDAAYSVRALVRFGLREETHAAFSWLLRTIKANGPGLRVFYGLDGSVPTGTTEYAVPGWNGIGPVVCGNPAQDQLQLGVFGDLLSLARTYVDEGNVLDVETGRMLSLVADSACDLWRNPDAGMWELSEPRHHTSSKMGCWQALDSAVHLAEAGQIAGSVDRWRSERERVREWIEEHCWNEELGAYVMRPGSSDLDTSVLLHAPSGFDRGRRMASTIDALVAGLGRGPLLYRYSGMEAVEHPFVACSFWLASALACVGRTEEATRLMDELVALGNDVGLYAEMIAEDGETFWGNLPQALTHLALINSAITIEQLTR